MNLLFDLDGTLTDPVTGITSCIQHALLKLGWQAPPVEQLKHYIGPPLGETFAELLATKEPALVEAAVNYYRERFAVVGMYENEVYPDVPEGLALLQEAGHRLWVVTSKPEIYARKIVDHFSLSSMFEDVYGSELSGKYSKKSELIAHMLKCESLDPITSCMIGDRAQDMTGGRANKTGTIGVLWGYGSSEELKKVEPDALVGSMTELCSCVGRMEVKFSERV